MEKTNTGNTGNTGNKTNNGNVNTGNSQKNSQTRNNSNQSSKTNTGTGNAVQSTTGKVDVSKADFVINTNTKKFHLPGCSSVDDMKDEHKLLHNGSVEEVIDMGYTPCARCLPEYRN